MSPSARATTVERSTRARREARHGGRRGRREEVASELEARSHVRVPPGEVEPRRRAHGEVGVGGLVVGRDPRQHLTEQAPLGRDQQRRRLGHEQLTQQRPVLGVRGVPQRLQRLAVRGVPAAALLWSSGTSSGATTRSRCWSISRSSAW